MKETGNIVNIFHNFFAIEYFQTIFFFFLRPSVGLSKNVSEISVGPPETPLWAEISASEGQKLLKISCEICFKSP